MVRWQFWEGVHCVAGRSRSGRSTFPPTPNGCSGCSKAAHWGGYHGAQPLLR